MGEQDSGNLASLVFGPRRVDLVLRACVVVREHLVVVLLQFHLPRKACNWKKCCLRVVFV